MKKSKKIGLSLNKKVISQFEKNAQKGGYTNLASRCAPCGGTYPFCVTGSHCQCL